MKDERKKIYGWIVLAIIVFVVVVGIMELIRTMVGG